MRKTLLLTVLALILTLPVSSYAESKWGGAVFAGVDFAGELYIVDVIPYTFTTGTSASVWAEIYYKATRNIDVGGGVMYLFERAALIEPDFRVSYLPIYGVIRVHPELSKITPYVVGRVGYNFFFMDVFNPETKVNGGLYWSAGGGIIIKQHYMFEVAYSENHSSISRLSLTGDIKHKQVTVSIGYNF